MTLTPFSKSQEVKEYLEIEKNRINLEKMNKFYLFTGGQRILKNDLLAPYLMKE